MTEKFNALDLDEFEILLVGKELTLYIVSRIVLHILCCLCSLESSDQDDFNGAM